MWTSKAVSCVFVCVHVMCMYLICAIYGCVTTKVSVMYVQCNVHVPNGFFLLYYVFSFSLADSLSLSISLLWFSFFCTTNINLFSAAWSLHATDKQRQNNFQNKSNWLLTKCLNIYNESAWSDALLFILFVYTMKKNWSYFLFQCWISTNFFIKMNFAFCWNRYDALAW